MPRRAGRRRGLADRADPNLIPLLDVVLQLIAFFMMLVHFGTRIKGATEAIRLPEAPAALPTSDPGLERLSVALDAKGRLLVDGKALDPAAASQWWADQAERRRAGLALVGASSRTELPTLVVVRADRSASYGEVRRMLQTAQAPASPGSRWSCCGRTADEPAPAARRRVLPGRADARHVVPAPSVLHHDLHRPDPRDPHRPGPANRSCRPAPPRPGRTWTRPT